MKNLSTAAHEKCADDPDLFDEAFRYHYVITDEDTSFPRLEALKFGDRCCHVGSALKRENLVDQNGTVIGIILGVAVTSTGHTLAEDIQTRFDSETAGARTEFEDMLVHTTGRFVVLIQIGKDVLIYQDASGMLGVLHNTKTGWISSNLFLSVKSDIEPNPNYFDPETQQPYIGGVFHHTPDQRVKRINPSYRFEIKTGQSTRFWPRADDKFDLSEDEYGSALKEIVATERTVLTALQDIAETALPLSGGFDSRTILACASPETRKGFSQIYTYVSRWINWHDFYIAQQLLTIDQLGLELFSCIQPKAFGNVDSIARLERIAELAGGTFLPPSREVQNGVIHKIKRDTLVLRGQQLPVLRGLGIARKPVDEWDVDYVFFCLLRLAKAGDIPSQAKIAFEDATNEAYGSLPENARRRCVDLLLMEGLNGPELAGAFGSVTQAFFMSPFNSRRFIQLFSSFERMDRVTDLAHLHILLEADARVLGVPLLGEVKTVDHSETDDDLLQRFEHRKWLRQMYSQKTGSFSSRFAMHRYAFGREGQEIKWRRMSELSQPDEDRSEKTE